MATSMKKILIVEDEEYLSEMYKIRFKKEGYEVVIAHDGEEGVKLAGSEQPDLVLLDLVLPKKDGYQVLEEIRKNDKTKNLIVYIISNLGQNGEINKGFKSGANGYLIKADLTPSQLVLKIKEIFAGKKVGVKRADVAEAEIDNKKTATVAKVGTDVLLIEDQEVLIKMYQLRLNKAGFNVEVANNGAWGLKLAMQKTFAAIIMDMVMPAMNGYEAIKMLKQNEKTKNIPIIVLSNSAQDNDIEQAKKLGVSRYLLKSQITPAKLVEEVKKAIK